jgi:hypothetical protein
MRAAMTMEYKRTLKARSSIDSKTHLDKMQSPAGRTTPAIRTTSIDYSYTYRGYVITGYENGICVGLIHTSQGDFCNYLTRGAARKQAWRWRNRETHR